MTESESKKGALADSEKLSEAKEYLMEYSVFRKLLECGEYRDIHFGNPRKKPVNGQDGDDICMKARLKCFEIRRFVNSLPSGDEKVFLFLRYIHGETLVSCAEKIGISERTVFRLQKRALLMAWRKLPEYKRQLSTMKCYE